MTVVRRMGIIMYALALSGSIFAEEVRSIQAGSLSRPDRAFLVLEDEGSLRRIHRELHASATLPPAFPVIDFDQDLVLLAFMGQRSTAGYAVSFDSHALVNSGVAHVRVIEKTPPSDAMLASVITSPYVMAALGRGKFSAVRFIDAEDRHLALVALHSELAAD